MRRLFWVSLGAVAGVAGYRRATALARSLRPAPKAAGSLAGFADDVREGMALYMERKSARAPSTLEARAPRDAARRPTTPGRQGSRGQGLRGLGRIPSRTDELKDGR
jgi:hypothetical protein